MIKLVLFSYDFASHAYLTEALGRLSVLEHCRVIGFLDPLSGEPVQSESEELYEDVCTSDKEQNVRTVGL